MWRVLPAFEILSTGGRRYVINVVSIAGLKIVLTMGLFAASKSAVGMIIEALQES
jgi:short-subunit dehydrogenase